MNLILGILLTIIGIIILIMIVINTKKIKDFNFRNDGIDMANFGIAILLMGVYLVKIQLLH